MGTFGRRKLCSPTNLEPRTSGVKVVTYSRVSTSHHEQKPEVQVHELRRYCAARGFEIVDEIVDHGYSGATDNRPGLKKLMGMVRRRECDAVIITKLDRLFRSLKHLILSLDEFEALGVKFIAVTDGLDYTSPASKFFVQVLGALSQFEKALLVERTLQGLAHARATGKRLGRPKTRDDEAIRKLRSEGLSYTGIQKRLGCSRTAVYRALKGVPKPPYKKGN